MVDRQEAITKFVRQNLKTLLLDIFYDKVYEEEKRKFFDPIKRQVGIVRDSEIADALMDFLFKTNKIKSTADVDGFLKKGFVSKYVTDVEYYYQRVALEQSHIDIDLASLEQEDYKKKKIEELASIVLDQKSKEIEEATKKKQERYESVPSLLDEKDYPEPIIIQKEKHEQEKKEDEDWYTHLDLRQNPFPSIDGLEKIPEEDYDEIITKTEIYDRIVRYIRGTPSELFNNVVVYGQFGSGKTTLFQYIQKPMITNDIFPIYIRLSAQSDFQNFLIRFKQRLFQELRKLYRNISGVEVQEQFDATLEDKIALVLKQIFTAPKKCYGIVIFIDEIYKVPQYERVALDFVSHLQTFRGELTQELSFSNIGIWISAPPYWQPVLTHEPRYSGSVSKEIEMPMITMGQALDMLNRRFRTFAKRHDDIKEFKMEFVEQIYRRLESTNTLTFRQFIKEVQYQFSKGNFGMLLSNPIAIPPQTLDEIRSRFEYIEETNSGIKKILYSTMTTRNKTRCFKLLIKTVQTGEVLEESATFRENLFHFQTLKNALLISKFRRKDGKAAWKPSKELITFVNWVKNDFDYYLEDYFFKIYGGQLSIDDEEVHFTREDNAQCQKLLKDLKGKEALKTIYALIENSYKIHQRILSKIESPEINVDEEALTEDCKFSLISLTRAVALFFGTDDIVSLDYWNRFWNLPESVSTFIKQTSDSTTVQTYDGALNSQADPKIWYITSSYSVAFGDVVSFLSQQIERSRVFSLPIKNLRHSEIRELDKVREYFANRDYLECVSIVSKLVETRLRESIFHIFLLQYGEQFRRIRRFPDDQKKYINDNIAKDARANLARTDNECVYLNRSDYKTIIVGTSGTIGQKNWKHTFSRLLSKWKEPEILDYLDLFATLNLNSSHYKDKVFTAEQQNKIYHFLLGSIELLSMINSSYLTMLKNIKRVETGTDKPRFSYYFSLDNVDIPELTPIHITKEQAEKVVSIWKRDVDVYLDLSDKEQIENKYGLPFRELLAILGAIIWLNEEPKTRIQVAITYENGSEVGIRVAEVSE